MRTMAADVGAMKAAHNSWGWYMALGIVMILTGFYALYAGAAATLASVVAFGIVLVIAGLAQVIGAFMARSGGHMILALLVGILDVVVGLMLLQHPGVGALTITLLLAALFVFGGIYRFVAALWLQFPNYGWVAFSGVVSVIVGALLWMQWPFSAIWFIGLAVAINLVFAGASWCGIALKLKSL